MKKANDMGLVNYGHGYPWNLTNSMENHKMLSIHGELCRQPNPTCFILAVWKHLGGWTRHHACHADAAMFTEG